MAANDNGKANYCHIYYNGDQARELPINYKHNWEKPGFLCHKINISIFTPTTDSEKASFSLILTDFAGYRKGAKGFPISFTNKWDLIRDGATTSFQWAVYLRHEMEFESDEEEILHLLI